MPSLIDDSESRKFRKLVGNSDEDSKFEQEDNLEAPGAMRDLEPKFGPRTNALYGAKPSRSNPNIPQCPNQGGNVIPRSSSESQASFIARSQYRSTSAPEHPSNRSSIIPDAVSNTVPPSFERYHQDTLSVTEVKHKVFKLLEQSLEPSNNQSQGYVYALSMEQCPGYIKIGYTGDSIKTRIQAIEKCVPYKLQVYNKNDFHLVPNYQRVEKLIHEELRNERRKFACFCRKKATENDCLGMHGEWFAISETEASEVVDRWRKWMSSDPYTERKLRPTEQLRIDYYRSRAALFRWTDFVEVPWWKLKWLWLHNELHKPRPEKPNCSRWDSLCKHWMLNLFFLFTTFMFSYALFIILAMLPSALISTRYLALVNSIFLGGSAILYAA